MVFWFRPFAISMENALGIGNATRVWHVELFPRRRTRLVMVCVSSWDCHRLGSLWFQLPSFLLSFLQSRFRDGRIAYDASPKRRSLRWMASLRERLFPDGYLQLHLIDQPLARFETLRPVRREDFQPQ